jgi:hypothetical protein
MRSDDTGPDVWDRPWSWAWLVTVLGPLDGVSAAGVRARHAAVLAVLPAGAWLRRAAPLVVEEVDGDLTGTALAHAAAPWSGPAVVVLVGTGDDAGHVAVLYSHAVGDAAVTRRLVADLLATPDAPVLSFRRPRPSQTALAAAAVRHWARDPGRAGRAVRRVAAARAAARTAAPAGTGGTEVPPTEIVLRRVPGERARAMRRRRDREASGRSLSSLLLDATVAALRERDVVVDRVAVPVDLRRYLPGDGAVAGNLVSTVTLPGDTDEPTADLGAAVEDGLPLLQFLLTNARWRLSTALRGGPAAPAGETVPTLGWSDRGHAPGWESLPWGEGPRTVVAGALPRGARRVTVYLTRIGDELHLTALVAADRTDPATVADALDAALARLAPAPDDTVEDTVEDTVA